MRRLAFILSLYLFIGFGKTGAQQLILKNYAWRSDSVCQAVKIVPPIYSLWKKNSLLSPPGQELTGSIMLQNQYALVNEFMWKCFAVLQLSDIQIEANMPRS